MNGSYGGKSLQDQLLDRFVQGLDLINQSETELPTLVDFAEHISLGRWRRAPHLTYLANKLDGVLDDIGRGIDRRIIVSMPPRHGKTELIGVHLPVRYLCKFPDKYGIYCSYAAQRAYAKSRRARDMFKIWGPRLYGVHLNIEAKAAAQWHTDVGGAWIAAGVGGGITGEGGNLLVIDDPIKNRQQAESEVYRAATKVWYSSVFRTRLEPGGAIIIVMTRWHEDDLAGWLESGGMISDTSDDIMEFGDEWEVIRMPALAEGADVLGRTEGEALWPDRWTRERLLQIKASTDWYTWAGLFQQRPVALEGGLVKRTSFRYFNDADNWWECETDHGTQRIEKRRSVIFQTCDLAASESERASFTVIATWAFDPRTGFLLLLHVKRFRQESPDVKKQLRLSFSQYTPAFQGIEKAQVGIDAIQELKRAGVPVRELNPAGKDKLTRFLGVAAMYENHRVFHPRGRNEWLAEWEYEMLMFPESTHNDQADVAAYAGHVVASMAIVPPIAKDAAEPLRMPSRWRP